MCIAPSAILSQNSMVLRYITFTTIYCIIAHFDKKFKINLVILLVENVEICCVILCKLRKKHDNTNIIDIFIVKTMVFLRRSHHGT